LYIGKKPIKKKHKKKNIKLTNYSSTLNSKTDSYTANGKENLTYLFFWLFVLFCVLSSSNNLLFFFTSLTIYDIENLVMPSHNLISFSVNLDCTNFIDVHCAEGTKIKLKANDINSSSIFTIKKLIYI